VAAAAAPLDGFFVVNEQYRHGLGSSIAAGVNVVGDCASGLRLKSIGLALDDFGASGSTLHGLYTLPFGEIKIDRGLIADVTTVSGAAVLVSGLIDIAHRMDMTCCAVGVESDEQLRALDEAGCDLAQGFFIGSPVTAARLPDALADWTATPRGKAAGKAG
jgi:EAL domain-containing protein (putative c-di-GMP-specific phosphodiesterase class I)